MIDWVVDAARRASCRRAERRVGRDICGCQRRRSGRAWSDPRRGRSSRTARRRRGAPQTAAEALNGDAFVSVNSDSPLLDSGLITYAAALFRAGGQDLVSNVVVKLLPKGQSVEVISRGGHARRRRADGRRRRARDVFLSQQRQFPGSSPTSPMGLCRATDGRGHGRGFLPLRAAVVAACGGNVGKGWRELAGFSIWLRAT